MSIPRDRIARETFAEPEPNSKPRILKAPHLMRRAVPACMLDSKCGNSRRGEIGSDGYRKGALDSVGLSRVGSKCLVISSCSFFIPLVSINEAHSIGHSILGEDLVMHFFKGTAYLVDDWSHRVRYIAGVGE